MRWVSLSSWLVVAGCGLAAPKVTDLVVEVEPCGEWRARFDAAGLGQQVTADVGGALVGAWTVWGRTSFAFSGRAAPGARAEVRVQVGDSLLMRPIEVPAVTWTWTPQIEPPQTYVGDRVVVGGVVTPSCPVGDARFLARVEGREIQGPLGADGSLRVDVGPLVEGRTEVRVWAMAEGTSQELPPLLIDATPAPLDRDGDGHVGAADCDETRAEVHIDALEAAVANGRDDDCDGVVDEGTAAFDDDGDGLSEDAGDCDDADPARRPGAVELPDCRDQDCDGQVDEGVSRPSIDDPFEPDDDPAHAVDLHTTGQRAFTRGLDTVVRGPGDEAWWSFYSQDGDFDAWAIEVVVERMADGATMELVVLDDRGTSVGSARVSREGERLVVTGLPLRDDSGVYRLGLRPLGEVAPFCPARVLLTSR